MKRTEIEKVLAEHPGAVFCCGGGRSWNTSYLTNAEFYTPYTPTRVRYRANKPALRLRGNTINTYMDPPFVSDEWKTDYPLGHVQCKYADTVDEAARMLTAAAAARAARAEQKNRDHDYAKHLAGDLADLLKGIGAGDYATHVGTSDVTIHLTNDQASRLIEHLGGDPS